METLSGIGILGSILLGILIVFVFISGLMWFFVPFWILSIKNSIKNQNTKIIKEENKVELDKILKELEILNENIKNLSYSSH